MVLYKPDSKLFQLEQILPTKFRLKLSFYERRVSTAKGIKRVGFELHDAQVMLLVMLNEYADVDVEAVTSWQYFKVDKVEMLFESFDKYLRKYGGETMSEKVNS